MILVQLPADLHSIIDPARLQLAAQAAFVYGAAPAQAEATVVISDDKQIRQLNRQFLGIDAPTDVLSFPANFTDPESGCLYLGDMIISAPRARDQALAGGHSFAEEVLLLVVHGVLHLLGHDHAEEDEKRAMQAAQNEILASLGCHLVSQL
jgi:probable rRNA maturation factor